MQSYKIHATYKPKPWASLDGAVEINENRDDVFVAEPRARPQLQRHRHARAESPAGHQLRLQLLGRLHAGRHLLQLFRHLHESDSAARHSAGQHVASGRCDDGVHHCGASVGAAGFGTLSTYSSTDHFAHAEPDVGTVVKRVTTTLGYAGSFVRGTTTFLNPLTPAGTLDYNYVTPYVSIGIDIYRGLAYKIAWNYYGFDQ